MQENNNISSLFDRSGNLTPDTMKRYLDGALTPEEMAVVEKHLADSPFEREALEGMKKHPDRDISQDIEQLDNMIGRKAAASAIKPPARRSSLYYWIAAASVTAILALSVLFILMFRTPPLTQELAQATRDTSVSMPVAPEESALRMQEMHDEAPTPAQERDIDQKDVRTKAVAVAPPPVTRQEETADEEPPAESPPESAEGTLPTITLVEDEMAMDAGSLVSDQPAATAPSIGGVANKKENVLGGAVGKQRKETAAYTIQAEPLLEQEQDSVKRMQDIFLVVEQMPEFPGGEEAFVKYMSENLQYPDSAKTNGIQGRVFVTFVVETDGSISDVKVLRGIGGGCDEEAVRVVEQMPRWKPGTQRGQPVRVQYNLPIQFSLD